MIQPGERIRGRRGVELRKRRLDREPLCRDCAAKGLTTISEVPDHILPLAKGGLDVDSNIRCLCKPCHERRTAEEFALRVKTRMGLDGWPLE